MRALGLHLVNSSLKRTMIPIVPAITTLPTHVAAYVRAVKDSGFSGDIHVDHSTMLVNAVDNSIYQCLPQAVLSPRTRDDVVLAMRLLASPEFSQVTVTPRGGGTGTNGQSLTQGVVLDCSKHLNHITKLSPQARTVTVEPGVVLDQLNAQLSSQQLYFPPTLSPSNRATLGGMVATDACGKGSRKYGKTSDYIVSLELVLPGGELLDIHPVAQHLIADVPGKYGELLRLASHIGTEHAQEIEARYPKLNRALTGYNFKAIFDRHGHVNLNALISGAEGTLGVVTSITFRLIDKPKYSRMVVACYAGFDATLRAAPTLLNFDPLAIETFDSMIYRLASQDSVWHKVAHLMPAELRSGKVQGVNLIEFVGDSLAQIAAQSAPLEAYLQAHMGHADHALYWLATDKPSEIQGFWELRKRGAGLLGNLEGAKKPVPFVEDTAVPPEHLADYIRDFTALLDQYGLTYGMFGHVDTGCLHVRPALNLKERHDEARIREISDAVNQLVRRYGGLLWGEHGKGFRAEYTPELIGETLYQCQRDIKAAFDPNNQLNPGKIATAAGTTLAITPLDSVPLRGHFDRQISEVAQTLFSKSLECNGNGACFAYAFNETMCPSYKVTRDRVQSPKGRATLLREWLRLVSLNGYDFKQRQSPPDGASHTDAATAQDFSHEVYRAMQGCLGCKACTNNCPIKVDVPELKSRFLSHYHTRYRRPLRDHAAAYNEELAALMRKSPRLWRLIMRLTGPLVGRALKMCDLPVPSHTSLQAHLDRLGIPAVTTPEAIPTDCQIILLADAFTSTYDTQALAAAAHLLHKLHLRPAVFVGLVNGKAKHVKGFTEAFRMCVKHNHQLLNRLADCDIPIVGIEASITLTYRQEYAQYLSPDAPPARYRVALFQEWLATEIASRRLGPPTPCADSRQRQWRLFSHCSESASVPVTGQYWQSIFSHFGLEATPVKVGCCGMAGTYGHEREHQEESRALFDMSWQEPASQYRDNMMATGYSCRCQTERLGGFRPPHPVEVLAQLIGDGPMPADRHG